MIYEDEKKFYESCANKSLEEMKKIAEKNLRLANIEEFWIKKILNDAQSIYYAYKNDIPRNLDGGDLYIYLTTD